MTAAAGPPPTAPDRPGKRGSLRRELLLWLIVPLAVLVLVNGLLTYRNAVDAANVAYDRTLLTSARVIAENLGARDGRVFLAIPYAVTELLESDIKGRIFYRVTAPDGAFVAGWDDLPAAPAKAELAPQYATLVKFYEVAYEGRPIRAAELLQPLIEGGVNGIVKIQVAETFESRQALTRSILLGSLLRQGAMIVLVALTAVWVIHRALRPFDRFRRALSQREREDFEPFDPGTVHREVRPLVAALNAHMGRLGRLIETRKRFIANAAHQLRTPLAVLKTQTAFAQGPIGTEEAQEVIGAMSRTVDDASRLADQLLALSRAEHGLHLGQPQTFELLPLVRDVCLQMYGRAREHGIDLGLECALDNAATRMRGDAALMQELLVNLIDNAVRYGRDGQVVTVLLSHNEDGTRLRLAVRDHGPGIPAEHRERVLERFYRVPDQQVPGSGLGLAIVREIALQHGASVRLSESPGGGLTVTIELPRAVDPA